MTLPQYPTLKALRSGKTVDIGAGTMVKMAPGNIQVGDLYVAERNTGPKLLTCKSVNEEGGWIIATTLNYPYDIGECVKVEEA
ncbi:MAG: hypothetical protein HY457_00770 [Parcubacteria group bacterium]|nr:hypothetical protein [Parcubacteria group bacterium]